MTPQKKVYKRKLGRHKIQKSVLKLDKVEFKSRYHRYIRSRSESALKRDMKAK